MPWTDVKGLVRELRDSKSLTLAQPINCPQTCYMRRADVEALAEDWGARVPDRSSESWLADFLVSLGGDIRPSDNPNTLLLVAERKDCFLTTASNPWTLAEALAHLVLHLGHCEIQEGFGQDTPPTMAIPATICGRGPHFRARLEADWFALAFLTPSPSFTDCWNRYNGDLRKVTRAFGLPITMIAARSFNLGLS